MSSAVIPKLLTRIFEYLLWSLYTLNNADSSKNGGCMNYAGFPWDGHIYHQALQWPALKVYSYICAATLGLPNLIIRLLCFLFSYT